MSRKRHSALVVCSVMLSFFLSACSGDPEPKTEDGPKNGVYCTDQKDGGKPVCEVYGHITKDTTFTSGNVYLLKEGVFVGQEDESGVTEATATLTIEPGTTIKGSAFQLSFLSVLRGSKLMAEGTAEAPIVFTAEDTDRRRGGWGGLIINGDAPINRDSGVATCKASGEGGTGCYGGSNAEDSSGSLKYVRVEFAGYAITNDEELNGIGFQGVGSGTTVDHVQVHMSQDDGVELYGGTVNVKHLVVTGAGDDSIDWTYGWSGKLQHAVVQQYGTYGDNGIEADNNSKDNAASPRSNPTLSNVTLIGVPDSRSSDLGVLLREGTGGTLWNVAVLNFNDGCLAMDQDATFSAGIEIKHSLVHCPTSVNFCDGRTMMESCTEDGLDASAVEGPFTAEMTNHTGDPMLTSLDEAAPNYLPAAGSPLLGAGAKPGDAWFDDTDYIGAFGAEDWTKGWTDFSQS